jgi:uncharacterized membrane protein
MEPSISTATGESSWEIVPTNTLAWIIFFALFAYFFFRHFLFVMMGMDTVISWLRKFSWFPSEGKRLKAFIHWLIALGLFLGFLLVGRSIGWIDFVPQ